MNLLYCFDENYNRQTFISICSFLEQSEDDLNIYIIHQNPESFKEYEVELRKEKNINLYIFKFMNPNNIKMPIGKGHITEATYYRIFIEQFLPKEVNQILYIDSDIICLKNIESVYKNTFKNLNNSMFCIGAMTGAEKNRDNVELFTNLEIDSLYFNAGVMFIDLKKWKELKLSDKFQEHLLKIKEKIIFHDQDVMNSYLNGEYLQIEEELNFFVNKNTSAERLEQIKENVYLIHYAGSKKPWTFEGSVDKASYYYQNLNIKYLNSYHLISTYKKKDFLLLIMRILNLKILNSPKPLKLIYDSISNLLLNDKEKT